MVSEGFSKETGMSHVEKVDSQPPRRRSSVTAIEHTETPVWETRQTYTKHGSSSKMLLWRRPRANSAVRVHGYFQLEIRFCLRCLCNDGRVALWLRSRSREYHACNAT